MINLRREAINVQCLKRSLEVSIQLPNKRKLGLSISLMRDTSRALKRELRNARLEGKCNIINYIDGLSLRPRIEISMDLQDRKFRYY